jgi:hypothetical protein
MPRMLYEAWMERKYLTGSTGKLGYVRTVTVM